LTSLGSYTGSEVVRAFQRAGWTVSRQRGSHAILVRVGFEATLSVPVHKGKTVKRGTLKDLIKDAGLTSEEFVALV
jgi:predicted RNA binding protein YcfA (HicA-like mRNA interferase family)